MNPAIVMFAIEAGTKLGKQIYEVLVSKTVEKPLVLPVGEFYADVAKNKALSFFRQERNVCLRQEGGPYHEWSDDQLVEAYRSMVRLSDFVPDRETPDARLDDAVQIVNRLQAFEQYSKGFRGEGDDPSPVQRILGTIVDIGIDYFNAHPESMGKESTARRIAEAFISGLDEVEFAQVTRHQIVGDVFGLALRTLGESTALIDDDKRAKAILAGIVETLSKDIEAATSDNAARTREDFMRRVGSSLLRGAAGAFTENIDLFLSEETQVKDLVKATLGHVMKGIQGREDLFTGESLELIYKSALKAVGENPELLSDSAAVQDLIRGTVDALAESEEVFAKETYRAIVGAALGTVERHAQTLIEPDNPRKQLLADAVGALAAGLSTGLGGEGRAKDLLSRTQLVELASTVFDQVAENPERLLGTSAPNVRQTVLAQIIGSVARALGDDPRLLVSGEGLAHLVVGTVEVAALNVDKLIDTSNPETQNNLLFQVLSQMAEVVRNRANDTRGLATREVFLEIVGRVLPLASANVERLIEDGPDVIGRAVSIAFGLASGALENRTNGANLPALIEELLRGALWNELDLEDEVGVEAAARIALRAAA